MSKPSKKARNLCARDCEKAGDTISSALHDILAKVKAAGVPDAALFFEPESSVIFVMDRRHHAFVDSHKCSSAERQTAIVARIPLTNLSSFDAGAW